MTNDVTYIWSNKFPTLFNFSQFALTQNHEKSLKEMQEQADEKNNMAYDNFTLVRINQYNVHRVAEVTEDGMRAFVKVSFSKDKYDLIGNAVNYDIEYNWDFKPRENTRNVPQSEITTN
jgi:hypothetical protein